MRKFLLTIAFTLGFTAVAPAAPPGERVGLPEATGQISVPSWVIPAAETSQAFSDQTAVGKPIVLLETNFYTFLPGEKVQLRVTMYPNGWREPVTLYLYRQNRETGEKEYYSLHSSSFDPSPRDLFGQEDKPLAILPPTLEEFVLFGSASDGSDLGFGVDGALGPSLEASNQPGLYQFVFEVRDALGYQAISASNAMFSFVSQVEEVQGAITTPTTWKKNKAYVLRDFVAVRGTTLTIEPGTVIYGGDGRATLFITRTAMIQANGTPMRPIIFTSPNRVGKRAQKDWGSLVLFGNAPINVQGGQSFLEGLPSQEDYAFGGNDPSHNCGVLRYVRLEFGGFEIEANQEINGLTVAGCGDQTVLDYIQVLYNKDDGFEFFGGSANAKHLLAVGAADDGIDTDLGYTGKIQWVVILDSPANDEPDSNVAFEADNHPQNYSLTPRTAPVIYNVTALTPTPQQGGKGLYGARLRRGAAGAYFNIIIAGSPKAPVSIESSDSQALGGSQLIWDHSILFGPFEDGAFGAGANPAFTRTFLFETMKYNRNVDPELAIGEDYAKFLLQPRLVPTAGSPALELNYVKVPPDDGFFDTRVSCLGGVCPDHDWILSGWTCFSPK